MTLIQRFTVIGVNAPAHLRTPAAAYLGKLIRIRERLPRDRPDIRATGRLRTSGFHVELIIAPSEEAVHPREPSLGAGGTTRIGSPFVGQSITWRASPAPPRKLPFIGLTFRHAEGSTLFARCACKMVTFHRWQ